ncbi:MAG: 1-(5-phosphoribosyl)-5-[(5-phosphoribosylamino)methylideneamino]imidazole-4-carboxamide isomerase [Rikenellaceae bacterium]|nr:1-(5-phosphoribosyl)-5-[(5-phosphoribosylamino)methylideneamino]imidazole-4-carboxamide isomerase [Rikenellaceae bacterium]
MTIEIIPAIDLIDGKCVRLTQGDYGRRTTYFDDPLDAALMFRDAGLRRLHMVDLDGAKHSSPRNLPTLERVAASSGMRIQFGGGIKTREALRSVLSAGADMAICGSIAADDPGAMTQWLKEYGGDKLILGADVRDGMIATHGWLRDSGIAVEKLIGEFLPVGLKNIICTDISRDGTLTGPNFDLYRHLRSSFPGLNVTASGGISSMEDIERLDKEGIGSVILGKAFYKGSITLRQLEDHTRC